MTLIGVLGSKGRMGESVCKLVASEFASRAMLAAQVDRGQSDDTLLDADIVIDFSMPQAMLALAQKAMALPAGSRVPAFVVGSTGWKLDERRVLEELAKKTLTLMASNFSMGVMVLTDILRHSSPLLEKLGYKPVLLETHHQHKKDSPSGTALSLQRAIAPAGPGNVQTMSIRAGEIIGDHEITYFGKGDTLELKHSAQDRAIFARGAIETALWLSEQRAASRAPTGLLGIEAYFQSLKEKMQ